MKEITKDDLQILLQSQLFGLEGIPPLSRLYCLATDILIHILGYKWVFNNIFGQRPLDEFLRSNPQSSPDNFKSTDRCVELAETLFNLQHVSGIETLIDSFKKKTVEANVAELQSAKLLYFNDIPFSVNIPSGNKTLDFDAIATIGGLKIPCEFKCKLESTDLSKNTIKQVLSHARKQLPKDETSVIFLKIPEEWTHQDEGDELLTSVISNFLSTTTRINSVVYHWEEWEYRKSGQALRSLRFNEIANPNSSVKLGRVLRKPGTFAVINKWTYLNQVVQGVLGESGLTRISPNSDDAGFSWHAVLRILSQVSNGDHVIYELGLRDAERITLLIDRTNHVRLEIIDSSRRKYKIESKESVDSMGLNEFAYFRFQLSTVLNFSELSLWVNNKLIAKKTVPLQSSIVLPKATLGADLAGNRKAAFVIMEMRTFDQASEALNQRMTEHFNRKFGLNIQE